MIVDYAAICAAHFRAAIEQADLLPQKDERAGRALTLLLKLGPAANLSGMGDRLSAALRCAAAARESFATKWRPPDLPHEFQNRRNQW
jgi:hypothetical protein